MKRKKARYPQNLYLRAEVKKSGRTVTELSKSLSISREVVSLIINGHYLGNNVVPRLKQELGIT